MMRVFCMRLKTAGIVIGWLGIMPSIGAIFYITSMLVISEESPNETEYCIILGAFVLQFVVSGLLAYGTYKNRESMLIPWLILTSLFIVTLGIHVLKDLLNFQNIVMMLVLLAMFGFKVYIYLGVMSLYKEIILSKKQPHVILMQSQVPQMPPPSAQTFFCLRLKPGSLVVGWIHVVLFSLASLLLLVLFTMVIMGYTEEFNNEPSHCQIMATFASAVVHTLASYILLLGIRKNKHMLMLPWLVDVSIMVVFFCWIIHYQLIIGANIFKFLAFTAFTVIWIYMFLAVYAYYKEVQQLNDRKEVPLLQTQVPQMSPTNPGYPYNNKV